MGAPGALVAGLLFVLPGFLAILALSIAYVTAGHLAPVTGLFFGLKAAILAIVVDAVIRIGRRSLRHPALVAIAAILTRWLLIRWLPIVALALLLGAGHVLFVLAGAPYAEWLGGRRTLDAALNGIMAAVVGVILNLAVWAVATFRFKVGMLATLVGAGCARPTLGGGDELTWFYTPPARPPLSLNYSPLRTCSRSQDPC